MITAASQVTGDLPRHVAIIMDGNNRWAKARQLKPQDGHSRGAEVARKIVAACIDRNIPYLTLFAFSSENWLRPQTEVRALMALFLTVLRRDEISQLHVMGVRIRFIGNRSSFSKALQKGMLEVEKRTEANLKTTVFVAVITADAGISRKQSRGSLLSFPQNQTSQEPLLQRTCISTQASQRPPTPTFV